MITASKIAKLSTATISRRGLMRGIGAAGLAAGASAVHSPIPKSGSSLMILFAKAVATAA